MGEPGKENAVSDDHVHDWHLPDGPYVVIDTYPEQHPYVCECGAFTHNPETGRPCPTCAPGDFARRTADVVTLRASEPWHKAEFDDYVVPRPLNQVVMYPSREPSRNGVQKFLVYRETEDRDIWEFGGYRWSVPFEPRQDTADDTAS